MKEAKLLDSIGTAQMEQELTNRVLSFAKVHSNGMREETVIEPTIQEDDLKQYLEQVIREVKGKTTNNR